MPVARNDVIITEVLPKLFSEISTRIACYLGGSTTQIDVRHSAPQAALSPDYDLVDLLCLGCFGDRILQFCRETS